MEKLIEKYNEECNLTSKVVSRLWKIGLIIIFIIAGIYYITKRRFLITFWAALLSTIILYFICECIEVLNIANKLRVKYKIQDIILRRKKRNYIYQQFDKFQKNWITVYCKKNKINTVEKLKIVREELQEKQNNNVIKYLDPLLIGTLLLTIWEIVVQKLSEKIGVASAIVICVLSSFTISIIVGWLKKEWQEQKKFMQMFNKYSGYDRLKELVIYRILKTNK